MGSSQSTGGARVLIITADRTYATSFTEHLADRFEIAIVESASDALETIASESIDCVVSDHDLPDVDGIALLETIRAQHPDLPFILFTSEGNEAVASRAINAHVTDYLIKERVAGQWDHLGKLIIQAIEYHRSINRLADPRTRGREVMNALPDGVFIVRSGAVIFGNTAALRTLKIESQEALLETDLEDLIDDSDRSTLQTVAEIQDNDHYIDRRDVDLVAADGSYTPVELTTTRIDWEGVPSTLMIARDITDRKQVERAHQQSVREFEQILNRLNDAVFLHTPEGDMLYVNETAVHRLGYSEETLLGMTPAEFSDRESRSAYRELADRTIEEGNLTFETAHLTANGERIPVEINSSNVRFRGQPAILSVARDISERMETESDLRRIQRAVEASGHTIYITDTEGTIQYVNPAFEDITGYPKSEAVGRNPRILKSGEMPDSYYEQLWETILAGEVWEEEVINQRRDGDRYHAHQTIAPVEDGSGTVDAYVAIQTDITDQIRQERRLETLISNLPGMVYRCRNEPGWPMELVRGEVTELVGYSAESLEKGSVQWGYDIIHPADRGRVWEAVQSAIERNEPFELVYRIITNDDDDQWVWERGRVVKSAERGSEILEGFIMDITPRKHLEDELRETIRLLQVVDRVLRHNFNNEMNLIMGSIETLLDSVDGEAKVRARMALETSHELLATVNKEHEITELLSTPTTGQTIELGSLISEIVERYRERFPEATFTVDVPPKTEVRVIDGFSRAIEELLTNAVIHSDRDRPSVAVDVESNNDSITIAIADDGPGIPEMERAVLTGGAEIEPLYHGSGLGLWLVNLIVQRSGGTLSLESKDPRGSVVTIHLTRDGPIEAGGLQRISETDLAQTVLSTIFDGIAVVQDERITYANDRFLDLLDYTEDDIIGSEAANLAAPEYREELVRRYHRRIAGDEVPGKYEIEVLSKTGDRIPVEMSVGRIDIGSPGVVVVIRDISERKAMESANERLLDLLKHTEALANVGGWELDLETQSLVWTDGTRRIHEVSETYEPTLEEGIRFFHPEDRAELETALSRCRKKGIPYDLEARLITAEGNTKWVRTTGERVETDGKTLLRGAIRPEPRLERRNEELRILNRITRHDIRNDMTVIAGWTEELGDHIEEDAHPILDRIRTATQHVIELTKTVRDFVDELGTDREPSIEPTDLRAHLTQEVTKRSVVYPDVSFSIEGDLPDVAVEANELISSIFRNLLNNAVQHNDKDDPRIEISVTVAPETVTVRVADNGPGIADDQKETVFGRDGVGLNDPGAGIGLYLVDTLVEAYGGRVWIEDNEPEGAVIVVELRRADGERS